ncbi:MAG: hypothetical protein DWQ49_06130 [Bacteroidetes bacterium]|jgi:hypothetical protein|nr:MAG: hypothetical protein DWQ49_06130 [Bacteroidota bacterium]
MIDEVTILGRGQSLEKLDTFSSASDFVITCNCFWDYPYTTTPYYKNPIISKFLKNKRIAIVATLCNHTGSDVSGYEKTFDIVDKYNTCFSSGSKRRGQPLSGFSLMPDSCLNVYNKIGESKIKTQGDYIPGTLAYAVILAIAHYKFKKVNIFGLDFYESDYYIKQLHDYSEESSEKEIVQNKIDFSNFFNYFKDVEFCVHTLANFNPNAQNVSTA